MIFIDTSGILALIAEADRNHAHAVRAMESAVASSETLLIHNYVISETASLLQRRAGLPAALGFLSNLSRFNVHWLTEDDHHEAVDLLRTRARRQLSLVDCTSFVVMRNYDVDKAFTYDSDFIREGFIQYLA